MSDLITRSESPFNAEPPLAQLGAQFVTPQQAFYIRSHGPVPTLSGATHRIQVRGRVAQELYLSVQELRDRFTERTVAAVMQCAGNRRGELHRVRPVKGDPWSAGAIGNAQWTGVSLVDVLRAAQADLSSNLHVAFQACDTIDGAGRYAVSIPMEKALCPDVLLAYAMNGEPLTPPHGFPLRVVVPGYAGVRSPKWLSSVTVQDCPSDTPTQQTDYKLLPPDMTPETADWQNGITINEMPVNAAICIPDDGAVVPAGSLRISGYATAGTRSVTRVDVSVDGGGHWCQAALTQYPDQPWAWTLWRIMVPLATGEHELTVRAWDSAGQTQPAWPSDTWNFKGYLCSAWHRIRIRAS